MTGTKIKQFDNGQDNTVKAFVETFNITLNYPTSSLVDIGGVVIGGLRQITITHLDNTVEKTLIDMDYKTMVWSRDLNTFVEAIAYFKKGKRK